MGKIVDTELNVIGGLTNGDLELRQEILNGTTTAGLFINGATGGDLPAGTSIAGFEDGGNLTLVGSAFDENLSQLVSVMVTADSVSGTFSSVSLTPQTTYILTENIDINGQVAFSGDVLVGAATFSIVNGLIVNVIQ